jgi:hypothetical protein
MQHSVTNPLLTFFQPKKNPLSTFGTEAAAAARELNPRPRGRTGLASSRGQPNRQVRRPMSTSTTLLYSGWLHRETVCRHARTHVRCLAPATTAHDGPGQQKLQPPPRVSFADVATSQLKCSATQ